MFLFKDGLIERVFGRIEVFCGLMIADCRDDVLVLWCSPLPGLRDGSGNLAPKMWP